MRVYAVSDIHIDYEGNAKWLARISRSDHKDDILILAGDVSDDPRLLEWCFRELADRFKKVMYVPGNHDLWVLRRGKGQTSIDRYQAIGALARELGVSMEPFHTPRLSIVPLLSWYDYSFGEPSEELERLWMDYRACVWPENLTARDITHYFLMQNQAGGACGDFVVSFSHFLPRLDVMPAYIPKSERLIYPVLGSSLLETSIRELQPDIHVYGHSHVNRRVAIDGITYVNNAFGYPSETRIAAKKLLCLLHL